MGLADCIFIDEWKRCSVPIHNVARILRNIQHPFCVPRGGVYDPAVDRESLGWRSVDILRIHAAERFCVHHRGVVTQGIDHAETSVCVRLVRKPAPISLSYLYAMNGSVGWCVVLKNPYRFRGHSTNLLSG